MPLDLQELCELGQQQLMRTEYLQAERTLEQAEEQAWQRQDFDTLSRLYMPLQEARRQRRQTCGEGIVRLDFLASSAAEQPGPVQIIQSHPQGQFLVAGWGSVEPAIQLRKLQRERMLYGETFLAAVYPTPGARLVVVVPTADVKLPSATNIASVDALIRRLPAHCVVLSETELFGGDRKGNSTTFSQVMQLWERLHAPFLAAADMQIDPVQKIEGYRRAIKVDYACELAHQHAAQVARDLARQQGVP